MLQKFSEVLKKHEITLILVFGTCLGPVRDQKLISYDSDLDVACYYKDRPKLLNLFPDLIEKGFVIGKIDSHKMVFSSPKSDIVIDVWLIQKAYNPLMVLTGHKWFFESGYYKKDFFNEKKLTTAYCEGTAYLVPNLVEEFLETLYGPDWRTPIKGRHAVYRAFLSRLLHHLFLESDMPVRYSSKDDNIRFKPWADTIAKILFPKAKFTKKYKRNKKII